MDGNSHAEKDPPHLRAVDQGVRRSGDRQSAPLQDVAAASHGEGKTNVLLDKQNRHPLSLQRLKHRLELLSDLRRETKELLVDHQQARKRHKAPADGEHLLLIARKATRELVLELKEARE